MNCWKCGVAVETVERVAFRDDCQRCGWPLHACRNCGFYDPGFHNQCREPMAEMVADKERANFCDYFTPADGNTRAVSGATAARERLETLFRKRS